MVNIFVNVPVCWVDLVFGKPASEDWISNDMWWKVDPANS
jgi:hypothetical protein